MSSDQAASNADDGFVDIIEARRRKEVAEAKIAEMKEAQMRRELIALSAAEAVFGDRLTKARVNLEAIPTRIAAVVAGMIDPVEIRDLIRHEIEAALMAAAAREGDDVYSDT